MVSEERAGKGTGPQSGRWVTHLTGALAHVEEAESSLGPNQIFHLILDGVSMDEVPLFCCLSCKRGLHLLPMR